MQIELAASVLDVPRAERSSALLEIEDSIQAVHFDVMDGVFVPQKALSIEEITEIHTDLPKWVHLMVERPREYLSLEVDRITFHAEAECEVRELLEEFTSLGRKVGLALSPESEVEEVEPFLDLLEHVLIMTVEPGKGGQVMMPETLSKIQLLREACPDLNIAVDGGINAQNIERVAARGANVFAVGSGIFRSDDPMIACEELLYLASQSFREA